MADDSLTSTDDVASRLAAILPQMMFALVRLGNNLPQSISNLTPQQLRLLKAVQMAGGPTRMSDLAATLGVTQSTMTEASKRLIQQGYIARARLPEDDRVVCLSLTEAGEAANRDMQAKHQALFADICRQLDTGEQARLLEAHLVILETYRKLDRPGRVRSEK